MEVSGGHNQKGGRGLQLYQRPLWTEIDYCSLVPIYSQIKYHRVTQIEGEPHAIYGIYMQFWNPAPPTHSLSEDTSMHMHVAVCMQPNKDTTTLRTTDTYQHITECGWPPNLQEETLEGGEGAEQTERGEGENEQQQQQDQQEEEQETIECYVEKRYSECVALFRAILKTDANSRKMALLRPDNKFFSPFNRNYPRMFKLRRIDLSEFFKSMCNENIVFNRQATKLITDFFQVHRFRPQLDTADIDRAITTSLHNIFGLS